MDFLSRALANLLAGVFLLIVLTTQAKVVDLVLLLDARGAHRHTTVLVEFGDTKVLEVHVTGRHAVKDSLTEVLLFAQLLEVVDEEGNKSMDGLALKNGFVFRKLVEFFCETTELALAAPPESGALGSKFCSDLIAEIFELVVVCDVVHVEKEVGEIVLLEVAGLIEPFVERQAVDVTDHGLDTVAVTNLKLPGIVGCFLAI